MAMKNIVERLKLAGNRDSTKRNYYGIWKNFNKFYIRLDEKPGTWEERLILFVGFLVENNKKASTIKSYVSAVKSVLQGDGVELNVNKCLISSMTKACRFINNKVRTRLPIQKGLLMLMLKKTEEYFDKRNQFYLATLYQALFSTAYFGLFRIGELVVGNHTIAARDVHVGVNKNKMLFLLRTSKTHWLDKKPQTVKICSTNRNMYKQYCPYRLLRNYTKIRKSYRSDSEPFFVFKDRSVITANMVRKVFKEIIELCGLNPKLYNLHGFRAGRSVDLFKANLDVKTIMKLGRWSSNIVYTYLATS